MKRSRINFLFSLLTIHFTLFTILPSFGNASAPYFYLGGSSDLQLFFPRDTVSYKHISMEKEEISILLFPGYGVVKGEYFFYNHSEKDINLFLGYPVNGNYESKQFYQLLLDSLTGLEARVNNSPVVVKRCDSPTEQEPRMNEVHNWYVWEAVMKARATTRVTVFFIVPTKSDLKRGYNNDEDNAFAYVLETGRPWKDSIRDGRILVEFAGGLTVENVMGVKPSLFKTDGKNKLIWIFEDLEPSASDNVILRYEDEVGDDTSILIKALQNKAALFAQADAMKPSEIEAHEWSGVLAEDFDNHSTGTGWFILILMFLAVFGIPIIIFILTLLFGIWLYRRYKKKKQKLS